MAKQGDHPRRLLGGRRGISSVEYALLLAVIGGGIVVAAGTLSTSISDEMIDAANCIKGISDDCPQG